MSIGANEWANGHGIGSATSGIVDDLGPEVKSYGVDPIATWIFIVFGALLIVMPVGIGIGLGEFVVFLVCCAVTGLPGLLLLRIGLRQRKVRLTIRERGFEYCDPKARNHSVAFSAVESVQPLRLGIATRLLLSPVHAHLAHQPNGIAVRMKDASIMHIKCLSPSGTTEGCAALQECLARSKSPL